MTVLAGGELASRLSSEVVKIMASYTGRGPTKARALIGEDVVLVIMQDTLTKAERSLLTDGSGEFVMAVRQRFQKTMELELIAAVEKLTNRKVVAFMSSNHMEPDMASEVFVLAPTW